MTHDVIKDPYVLEFLDIKDGRKYLETELEQGLIDKLHDFLLELGKGFSFIAWLTLLKSKGKRD